MKLDWAIKITDILTLLTIIVSVIALAISWNKDRYSREKEQTDQVRIAAAKTLTKLDRWQALQLSIFQELQPVFVEISEMLLKDFTIVKARDHLWKTINSQRTHIAGRVLDEQIETAYVDLLSYFPAARNLFLNTLGQLKVAENESIEGFLVATQTDILSFEGKKETYETAALGNALRTTAANYRMQLETKTSSIIEPVRKFIFEVISKSDKEILMASRSLPGS
jgi:hypothetical protein